MHNNDNLDLVQTIAASFARSNVLPISECVGHAELAVQHMRNAGYRPFPQNPQTLADKSEAV